MQRATAHHRISADESIIDELLLATIYWLQIVGCGLDFRSQKILYKSERCFLYSVGVLRVMILKNLLKLERLL